MKTVQNRIEVWKIEGDETFTCDMSLGPCPHCLGYELSIVDVRRQGVPSKDWWSAVYCDTCGARGPTGGPDGANKTSAEKAVEHWNNTMGVLTVYHTHWRQQHLEIRLAPDPFTEENDPF